MLSKAHAGDRLYDPEVVSGEAEAEFAKSAVAANCRGGRVW